MGKDIKAATGLGQLPGAPTTLNGHGGYCRCVSCFKTPPTVAEGEV